MAYGGFLYLARYESLQGGEQVSGYSTKSVREPIDKDDRVYPCADCGELRSESEGAKIFTVCDRCWNRFHYKKASR